MILHLSTKFHPNGQPQRSYDVIPIFQDGAHKVGNLLQTSVLVTELVY